MSVIRYLPLVFDIFEILRPGSAYGNGMQQTFGQNCGAYYALTGTETANFSKTKETIKKQATKTVIYRKNCKCINFYRNRKKNGNHVF